MHPLFAQAAVLTHDVIGMPLKYIRIKDQDCWNQFMNGV